jgi:hypothetical protein
MEEEKNEDHEVYEDDLRAIQAHEDNLRAIQKVEDSIAQSRERRRLEDEERRIKAQMQRDVRLEAEDIRNKARKEVWQKGNLEKGDISANQYFQYDGSVC